MTSKHSPKEIFDQALGLRDPEKQAAFLDEACAGDEKLRAEVEALLKWDSEAGSFMDFPDKDPNVTLDVAPTPDMTGTVIGRYKLLEKVGEGGMATVYMAEQKRPIQRRVALKIIKLGMDTKQVIARFEAERQALAMMDHPNIAKVFDAGSMDSGRPYFVMELVKGLPITEFCDSNHLTTQERLELFVSVCQAVHHAHQKGIIHRDIKPTNIMVTLHDGKPVVKVIDFGIAKAVNQQLTEKTVFTRYSQMIGTPEYMSPEQAEMSGLDIDTRTDVFSLGVLLYELLTGTTPFDTEYLLSKGYNEMQRIIREEEPVRPSTKVSTLGDTLTEVAKHRRTSPDLLCKLIRSDLDWIVMKTLEKDRQRRYESVSELAADIDRHLRQEPVLAGRPSTTYRLRKFIRRNKLLISSVAVVAIILVLATTVSTQQAISAHTARKAESNLRKEVEVERDNAKLSSRKAKDNEYYATMNLLPRLWDLGKIRELQSELSNTEDYASRGFEWYYWQRMCRLDRMLLHPPLDGEIDFVNYAVFSPDGRNIASCFGRKIYIWDAHTRREITAYTGHADTIHRVVYSPDARWIATGSKDQTAIVWDVKSGRQLRHLKGHAGTIKYIAFSPDGKWIATASEDRTARIWDAASGQEKSCLRDHRGFVMELAFSPDGQLLATCSQDRTIKIWDLSNDQNTLTLVGHGANVTAVEYTPDGRRLISGSEDGTVKIWDAKHGTLLNTYGKHKDHVYFASVSPDGRWIVSGGRSGFLRIWNIDSLQDRLVLPGYKAHVYHAEFSPDGEKVVSGGANITVKVWDNLDGLPSLTLDYPNDLQDLTFSPDGQWLAASGSQGEVRIWDAYEGGTPKKLTGGTSSTRSIVFSPDGRLIACGGEDGTITVWDTSSEGRIAIKGKLDSARSVVFTPDGTSLISAGGDGVIRIRDAATGKLLGQMTGHAGAINDIAISLDGKYIASGGEDNSVRLWNVSTCQETLKFDEHYDSVHSVVFSPDGKQVISRARDRHTLLWSISSGEVLQSIFEWGWGPLPISISPDGTRLVMGNKYGEVRIADVDSGKWLLELKGHTEGTKSVEFSPDGLHIASGSTDNTIRIWRAASEHEVSMWREDRLRIEEDLRTIEAARRDVAAKQPLIQLSDEGAIKSWLILAPIPIRKGATLVSALEEEQLANEANLRPTEGDNSLVRGEEYRWARVKFENAVLDFNRREGRILHDSVGYAVCYVNMRNSKGGVVMRVDKDDAARVYLNRKLVYDHAVKRDVVGWGYVDNALPRARAIVGGLELKSGINVVVFKIVNRISQWQGFLQFVDSDGKPLDGLTVTLDPNDL